MVLAERELESWYRSFDRSIAAPKCGRVFPTLARFDPYFIGPLMAVADRWAAGWFGATSRAEMQRVCRRKYWEHYAFVRRIVPAERLLEFDLKDGWGPLCAFLGREVPAEPFPNTNESAAFQAKLHEYALQSARNVARRALPWAAGLAALALAVTFYRAT